MKNAVAERINSILKQGSSIDGYNRDLHMMKTLVKEVLRYTTTGATLLQSHVDSGTNAQAE